MDRVLAGVPELRNAGARRRSSCQGVTLLLFVVLGVYRQFGQLRSMVEILTVPFSNEFRITKLSYNMKAF